MNGIGLPKASYDSFANFVQKATIDAGFAVLCSKSQGGICYSNVNTCKELYANVLEDLSFRLIFDYDKLSEVVLPIASFMR